MEELHKAGYADLMPKSFLRGPIVVTHPQLGRQKRSSYIWWNLTYTVTVLYFLLGPSVMIRLQHSALKQFFDTCRCCQEVVMQT